MTTLVTPQAVELNGRKSFAAVVTAGVGSWRFDRDWCPRVRTWNGSRGYFAVVEKVGWIEHRGTDDIGRPYTRWYSFAGAVLERIPDVLTDWLEVAVQGPPPGAAGAWYGDRCRCGASMTRYNPDGWPLCDTCPGDDLPTLGKTDAGPTVDPF